MNCARRQEEDRCFPECSSVMRPTPIRNTATVVDRRNGEQLACGEIAGRRVRGARFRRREKIDRYREVSGCRSLRVPATTFIIVHSPSRSKYRDGLPFVGERRNIHVNDVSRVFDIVVPVERIELPTFGLQNHSLMAACECS